MTWHVVPGSEQTTLIATPAELADVPVGAYLIDASSGQWFIKSDSGPLSDDALAGISFPLHRVQWLIGPAIQALLNSSDQDA